MVDRPGHSVVIRRSVSRRRFMRAFTCVGAFTVLFPGFALIKTMTRKPVGNVVPELTDLVSNKTSATEVGNAYLSQSEIGKDPESIANSVVLSGGEPHTTIDEMKAALCNQIRKDFAQGRTVRIQGWVLSQTEASVCALVAITAAS